MPFTSCRALAASNLACRVQGLGFSVWSTVRKSTRNGGVRVFIGFRNSKLGVGPFGLGFQVYGLKIFDVLLEHQRPIASFARVHL